MKRTSIIAALLSLSFLAACTSKTEIPVVHVDVGSGLRKIPGNYAALVQTGGWALKTKTDGLACAAWSFDTDLNAPYEGAMRQALTANLQAVEFVTAPLPPAEIASRGFDGQVVVHQGNATSGFAIQSGFMTATSQSKVAVEATIAILMKDGYSFQKTVTGEGGGVNGIFTCDGIDDAIGAAANKALQEVVEDATLYIREGLRSR